MGRIYGGEWSFQLFIPSIHNLTKQTQGPELHYECRITEADLINRITAAEDLGTARFKQRIDRAEADAKAHKEFHHRDHQYLTKQAKKTNDLHKLELALLNDKHAKELTLQKPLLDVEIATRLRFLEHGKRKTRPRQAIRPKRDQPWQ